MAKFKAFKPQAMERIAKTMGYTGDMSGFQQYLDSNVSLKERMKQLEDSAMEMSKNGTIKQTQKQSEDTVGAFVLYMYTVIHAYMYVTESKSHWTGPNWRLSKYRVTSVHDRGQDLELNRMMQSLACERALI